MSWWLLLLLVFAVWSLWGIAAVAERAVKDARLGIPKGQRGGVSIAPVIPIVPLVLWIAAKLVDGIADRWGTAVIAWLHAGLAVALAFSLIRNLWRLRLLDTNTGGDDGQS